MAYKSVNGGMNVEQIHSLADMVALPSWFDPTRGIDERCMSQYIVEQLQDSNCDVTTMLVDIVEGGSVRENVIATQGSGKDFVLWVTGHMDTIQPKDDWPENARATARTLMQKGDKLSGLGVFDMKAGLWQMLELARTCNVPQGMTVVYLFLVDEERDSKGMLAALRAVGGGTIPMPHFVISPEISVRASTSRGKRFTNSRSVPVVTGRRGNILLKVFRQETIQEPIK
jgi:acetylornithine deacetylase/succinyl-diaminopimelate desuccinylase-like protein